MVVAIKFTFASSSQEFNPLFKSLLESVIPLIKDSDLIVRRVALQALNSAALNKPAPARELLPTILPALYDATIVQKDLIKIVTMGPFKYEVDEGLDYRKVRGAFSSTSSCPFFSFPSLFLSPSNRLPLSPC